MRPADVLRDEVNVKEVVLTDDVAAYGRFEVAVNARACGPRLGGDTQKVIRAVKDTGDQGNNYWDILPFGHLDAYANCVFYASLEAMQEMEVALDGALCEVDPGGYLAVTQAPGGEEQDL